MDSPDSLMERVRRAPAGTRLTAERTAAQLCAEVTAVAESLPAADGEVVGLRLPNGESWIVGLLALLRAGARPLLIAADAPRAEAERLMTAAGAGRYLEHDDGFRLTGTPGAPAPAAGSGVLLATSGSTGAPKLVLRSEHSLIAEGLRYREAVALDGTDRLLMPLPLSHAYALGWLAAALVTNTQIIPLPPTSLNAIGAELSEGATIVALVPTLARLLVQRQRRKLLPAPKLRLAMVGAGPVDERLDSSFRAAFGISTGRNYGSTETGALFSGLVDLPPLCVGRPMPGIRFRIVDDEPVDDEPGGGREYPAGHVGLLEVSADGGPWQRTHDLAATTEQGLVRILGRRHTAVRRGDRWVSPAEVESALREHPAVRDAHVRAGRGRSGGADSLIADVELAPAPEPVDEATLRDFARQRLSVYKVPERINLHHTLPKSSAGKAVALNPRYRLAGAEAIAAMRAYRRSELLFALADLGLIEQLAHGADADELAGKLGVEAGPLRWLLDTAVALGVLETGDAPAGDRRGAAVAGFTELLRLEAELSTTWLSRRALTDVIGTGWDARPFDTADLGTTLPAVYGAAMHGPHTAARTRLGLRLAGQDARARVLEVSAGPGRYLAAVLGRHPGTVGGHLLPTGRLAGAPLPCVAEAAREGRVTIGPRPPARAFDLCVVANAVHGPGLAADLGWLLRRLAPGGVLLIDDLFLPDDGPGTELGLDWLTHGGLAWPRLPDLRAAIAAAGGVTLRTVRLTPPECCLVLAREEN